MLSESYVFLNYIKYPTPPQEKTTIREKSVDPFIDELLRRKELHTIARVERFEGDAERVGGKYIKADASSSSRMLD